MKTVQNNLNGEENKISEIERLVNGKDKTERVVGVEIEDQTATLFIEQPDGTIVQEQRKNRWWILSHQPLSNKSHRLSGSLYYKWGNQYSTKEDWNSTIQHLRKKRADF